MTTWNIDSMHSEVGFKVKHLMISNVKGKFKNFTGSVVAKDDTFKEATINFSAEVASISTESPDRDKHLQSADFFDSENFPNITFTSKSIEPKDGDEFIVTGDMTMRGVTQEICLVIHFHGISKDSYGSRVAGFEITGSLSRKNFGLLWNAPIETGGFVLSDEVKIEIDAEIKEVK